MFHHTLSHTMIIPTRDSDVKDLREQEFRDFVDCSVLDDFNDLCDPTGMKFPGVHLLSYPAVKREVDRRIVSTKRRMDERFPADEWLYKTTRVDYYFWYEEMLASATEAFFGFASNMCSLLGTIFDNWNNPNNSNNCRNLARELGREALRWVQEFPAVEERFLDEFPSPEDFYVYDPEFARMFAEIVLSAVVLGLVIATFGAVIPAAMMGIATALSIARISASTAALIAIIQRVVEAGTDHTNTEALIEAIKQDEEFQALVSEISQDVIEDVQSSNFPVNCDELKSILENQTDLLAESDPELLPQRCSNTESILFTTEPDALDCELEIQLIDLKNMKLNRCQFLDPITEFDFVE